jgi:hypothetical protein
MDSPVKASRLRFETTEVSGKLDFELGTKALKSDRCRRLHQSPRTNVTVTQLTIRPADAVDIACFE